MRLIDADDLIKAFEALDLMNGQYAESFSNMAGNRSMEIHSAIKQEREIFKCSNCGNHQTEITVWINGCDYNCDKEFDFEGDYVGSENDGYSLEVKPHAESEDKE